MPSIPSSRATVIALILSSTIAAACGESASTEPTQVAHIHPTVNAAMSANAVGAAGLVKAVHAVTSRYHATAQALKAGYAEDPFCVEVQPLGGMGHHWVNFPLVDDVFDPMKPEVVLYAPDQRGKMKLIAVEYIVMDVGQTAPTFGGQAFDVGGAPIGAAHWTLHVWLHKTNPSGLFAPFNPDVDCP
jgi:hypothetical protein